MLLIAGGLLLWGSAYVHNTVQGQLAAQRIYFPPSAAFAHPKAGTEITPSMIPSVSQYAGQQLLTGQQAEAYADHFIAVHIANMGGGKTYSQLSTESIAQPGNTALATTVNTVFKGETLRSMLLNAYGWWKVSQITYIISLATLGLGSLTLLGGAGRREGFGLDPGGSRGGHRRLTGLVNNDTRQRFPGPRRRGPGKRFCAALRYGALGSLAGNGTAEFLLILAPTAAS
jgi:hypothetical protein